MNRLIIIAILVFAVGAIFAQTVLTCYDIQYTTESGTGNTYPSPYLNQTVTVQGIVTAEKYYTRSTATNYGFMISDPQGGPWSGLFIFTNQHHPQLGDLVQVTGKIIEYYGFTKMSPVNSFQVISQGNPVPQPTLITTSDMATSATAEQWESVFVMVQNVTVSQVPNNYQEFYVNDGTGQAQIDNQCFPIGHSWSGIVFGQTWAEIRGVVDYSFDLYGINPRNNNDLIREYSLVNSNIKLNSIPNAVIDRLETMEVQTSILRSSFGVYSYEMVVKFDPRSVQFEGVVIDSTTLTLSVPEYAISNDQSTLTISYDAYENGDYQGPIVTSQEDIPIIKLLFRPKTYGSILIRIDDFMYNDVQIPNIQNGTITVKVMERRAFLDISNKTNSRNIFNPQLNEKITLKYGYRVTSSGVNAKAVIRIYDAQGRLVSTPVNKNISTSTGIETVEWDGRDSSLNLLPIGLYYCHLEILERNTGHRESTVQPIVIRSILK